jgi:hypothetical protein
MEIDMGYSKQEKNNLGTLTFKSGTGLAAICRTRRISIVVLAAHLKMTWAVGRQWRWRKICYGRRINKCQECGEKKQTEGMRAKQNDRENTRTIGRGGEQRGQGNDHVKEGRTTLTKKREGNIVRRGSKMPTQNIHNTHQMRGGDIQLERRQC